MEHVLDQRRVRIGRGPGVDLALDDASLDREHAVLEFDGGGYRLRPATAGTRRSEETVQGGTTLKSEDRFRLGQVLFAYVLEPRSSPSS